MVFPEATMRAFGNSLLDIAEPLDGPWATRVRTIAAEHGIVIVAGMFTPGTAGDGGKVRNTLLVTGRGIDASYDKIHLFDAFGFAESDTVDAGTEPATFELDGVTFGLATCYDIRFPDLFTENADRGAEVNIVCASWGSGPRGRTVEATGPRPRPGFHHGGPRLRPGRPGQPGHRAQKCGAHRRRALRRRLSPG